MCIIYTKSQMIPILTKAISVNMCYTTYYIPHGFDYMITCNWPAVNAFFSNGAYLLRLLKEIRTLFIDVCSWLILHLYYTLMLYILCSGLIYVCVCVYLSYEWFNLLNHEDRQNYLSDSKTFLLIGSCFHFTGSNDENYK